MMGRPRKSLFLKVSPLLALIFGLGIGGCSHTHYTFRAEEPVQTLNDQRPSPVPQKTEFDLVEHMIASSVRYPVVETMDFYRELRSQDVNALDHVPASTWYTPRLGYQDVSSQSLVRGPEKAGPPQKPIKVTRAEPGQKIPTFMIQDARGYEYQLKFDPPESAEVGTAFHWIVNQIFWGFGYNVFENYLFFFSDSDIEISEHPDVDQTAVNFALWNASLTDDGRYRSIASLTPAGTPLGPVPARGTRKGDLNDVIPHENLRVLRALKVFSAWVNQTDIRTDNILDVYEGAPGEGYTRHYFQNFGGALGQHGLNNRWKWAGFEHFFSWPDMAKNLVQLGIPVKTWEKTDSDRTDPEAYFRADIFEPAEWKETVHFYPIQKSLPDDHYWAAKILSALTPEHLKALFKEVDLSKETYQDYLIETLLKRQDKLVRHYFSAVSPVEFVDFQDRSVMLADLARKTFSDLGSTAYQIRFFDRHGNEIAPALTLTAGSSAEFSVPLPENFIDGGLDYLRMDVNASRNGLAAPRNAEFHLSKEDEKPLLAGVLH